MRAGTTQKTRTATEEQGLKDSCRSTVTEEQLQKNQLWGRDT